MMKRYIYDCKHEDFTFHDTDVAIIGSGIAGLYSAFSLDDRIKSTIFTKENRESGASVLAQGGIAAVTERDDRFEFHFQDTIKAGAGLCDEKAVDTIVREGPTDILRLMQLGVNFDVDVSGKLITGKEGGHGKRRILHCGGDATGREIVKKLNAIVKNMDNVSLEENSFVVDISTDDKGVNGLIVYKDGWHFYRTNCVIVAAGGVGQIYRYTTNPSVATGDGIAMAMRAGAKPENMEFIQFHPTGFYSEYNRNRQCFLISEALRGEGAYLYNEAGERFMLGRHALNELAPRDIVAREIYKEIQNQKLPYVKLDITNKSEEFLEKRFPTIYKKCLEYKINISKDQIPVGPVQHYMMGGIKTDLNGRTNVEGLFACGEAACTGVHGANRLASNSTLECLVFGRRCAELINESMPTKVGKIRIDDNINCYDNDSDMDIEHEIIELKGIMVKHCGIVREAESLAIGIKHIDNLVKKLNERNLTSLREYELYNMAYIAQMIICDADKRKVSAGAHFRKDSK